MFGLPVRDQIGRPAKIPRVSGSRVDHGWNWITPTGTRKSQTAKLGTWRKFGNPGRSGKHKWNDVSCSLLRSAMCEIDFN